MAGRRRRRGRWWRWPLIGVVGVVTLAIALVLAIVWIPAASQLVIREVLTRWDASVPARIEWRSLNGSLGAGLRLDQLALTDGDGQPLVSVDRLELDVGVWALLRGLVRIDRLALAGVEVWSHHDWGDLADPDAPVEPPTPGYGPDLPVEVHATITVDDGRVWLDERERIAVELVQVWAHAHGREATAELVAAQIQLPSRPLAGVGRDPDDLEVSRLALAARWDSPIVHLDRLWLDSPLLEIPQLRASYNVARDTGTLALDANVSIDVLADQLGLELEFLGEHAHVNLDARGGPRRLELALGLDLGSIGELHVHADGAPTRRAGPRWAEARVRGRLGAGVLANEARQGPIRFELRTNVRERRQRGFVANLAGDIHDVRSGEQLSMQSEATASSLDPLHSRATVELRGAGLDVDAIVERDSSALHAALTLRSDELQRPLGLAAELLDQPALAEVTGQLAVDARCEAEADGEAASLASLVCRTELSLERASGFGVAVGEASLNARIEPLADPLALDAVLSATDLQLPGEAFSFDRLSVEARGTLARLRVHAAGQGRHEQLQLVGAISLGERIDVELGQLVLRSDRGDAPTRVELRRPTWIGITRDAIDIHELALAAAGGHIDVDGQLGLADGVASDLRVDIADLELARLDPLVPGPALAGRLSLEAALVGPLPEPDAWVSARGHDLRIAGWRPGDVELDVAYADPGLRVGARVHGPIAEQFSLSAFVPLRLAGGVRLVPDRPLTGHLVVNDLDLVELGPLMPDTPRWWRQVPPDAAAPPGDPKLIPGGLVDLELLLTGTPDQPRVDATILARRLVVDRTRLGSLFARGSLGHDGANLWLVAKPGFVQIDLRARVPVTLDLAGGELAWSRDDDRNQLSVDLVGLDLARLHATLGPKLPALERALEQAQLQGVVSLSLRGAGSMQAPKLTAALRTRDLRLRDHAVGRLRVLAGYAPGAAELELQLDGPLARRLHARVRAPVWLPHAEQPLRVDVTGELFAAVHVDELSLPALARSVPLPITGSVSGSVELTGSLEDPQLDLRACVDELARSSTNLSVGVPMSLSLAAGFERGRAHVDAELSRAGARIITAAAELPLIVAVTPALTGSEVRWDRAGQHRVLVRGRRIDDRLLGALLGRALVTSSSAVPGSDRETTLEFEFAGAGRLDAFRITGALAGRLAVDDQLALELDVGLALDEAKQRVDVSITPTRGAGLTGSLELAALVTALVAGDQQLAMVPFDVRLLAPEFDLRWIAGLLPPSVVDPRGTLHADVRGRGRLGAPRLIGSVELAQAAITVIPLRQRLDEIDLELEFDEDSISLDHFSLDAGRGGAKGSGHVELVHEGGDDAGWNASLDLKLTAFPLIRPGLPAMIVDSGVLLELRRRGHDTDMTVVLREPEVTVAGMNESPPAAIPNSPDVVVLGAGPPELSSRPFAAESADPDSPETTADNVSVRIELRDPLLISGAAIDMAWAGALELQIDGGEVEVGGQVVARRGRLRLFGNAFDLRRGIVTLPADGTLDPYIDLEAVSSLPAAEVTVLVRGRLSRPTLEFSSNPALSDYEILTLLITGSTEIGESDGDVATKAASLLAAVSNPQLQAQLNQRLGLDRVALGFGETIDQPILTVGKRLGRDVYVESRYHHNAPDDQNTVQMGIEYGFLPQWSVEASFGDAAVGGLGLFWTRSFPAAAWASKLRLPDLQIEH